MGFQFISVRCLALVLLLSQGLSLAYGVGPFVSGRCACEHGPRVPCDCPHHSTVKGEDPPPCHLHVQGHPAGEPTKASSCSIRAHCGSTSPVLMLVIIASVPCPDEPRPQLLEAAASSPPLVVHPSPPASPPRPPPKARRV